MTKVQSFKDEKSIVEKLFGIIRHHGLEAISQTTIKELMSKKLCTQEQINKAQEYYLKNYFFNSSY